MTRPFDFSQAAASGITILPTLPPLPAIGDVLMVQGIVSGRVQLIFAPPGGSASVFLPLAGGTLTGPLILAANPVDPLGAATKQYADAIKPDVINTISGGYLQLTGGTLTGMLSLPVTTPTLGVHATSKSYVDAQVSTAVTGVFLPLTGGTLSGGLSFGAAVGANQLDFSRHITLHAGGYGIGITNNRINFVAGGNSAFSFQAASAERFFIGYNLATSRVPFSVIDASYNIMASGAVGDGVTDDRTAIQNWLNTLPKGVEVTIPGNKQFLIDSGDLTVPPGITIKGHGSFLESPAGQAGGNLMGPAIILNPDYSILIGNSVRLSGFKVLRKGLLSSPSLGEINTAVATWAAEAPLLRTSASTASGNTLPFANTTGVTVGMKAFGQNLPSNGTTVSAVVPNVSVTFASVVTFPVPQNAYVRFGNSLAIRLLASRGGANLDRMFILGFNTAILTESGRFYVNTLEADCNTILNVVHGGDASYVNNVHCIPYYGQTTGAGAHRPGPAFLLQQADGWDFSGCAVVGWVTGFVLFGTGGAVLRRCWHEVLQPDGVTVTTGFRTEGAVNVSTFAECVSSACSIGFDMQHGVGARVNLIGCVSAPALDGTQIAHYRLGPASSGTITSSMINAAGVTPFVVQAGVGKWKLVTPQIRGAPSPWITIAAGDVPNVSILSGDNNDTNNQDRVQTHLQEKVWISRDTSVASVDGSPAEALAIESLAAGTADTPLLSFMRNGVRLGAFSTSGANTSLRLGSDASSLSIALGAVVAASTTDLTKHISLFGTQYGINVTGSRLNYVLTGAGSHYFLVSGADQLSIGAGVMQFLNATSNLVNFGGAGIGAPTFTTRSAGTKIAVFAATGATSTDMAIGVEASTMWQAVRTTADQFKWYGGVTQAALLNGLGDLRLTRGLGVHNTAPVTAKPAVTGSRAANAALASLLTALASYGLVTDSSTA